MFGIDDIILGATIAGSATSLFGAFGKKNAQDKLLQDELEAEQLRRTQMEYDAARQQRSLIRNAQVTRSITLSNQTSSGASGDGRSSASGGAAGQTQGQQGVASNNIYQNLQIGEKLFDVNKKIAYDKRDIGTSNDIIGLGGMISGSGGALGRIFGGGASAGGEMGGLGANPTEDNFPYGGTF